MSEWFERPLSSLGRYLNGFAFKPHHWGKEGLPIVRIEQLNNPDGRYDFCSSYVPADNVIDDGDLIFSWSATLKVAIWRHGRAALNQHLFKVVPYPDTDKEFLFQLLDHHMEALAGEAHGSTMRHIKRSELDKFIVPVPDRDEQSLLGRVLRALDTQIEATAALIAKQERVRTGLLRDLFTRGVDDHGQLRRPRDEAPHLYHQTELGLLPLGWDATPIGDLISAIEQGWSPDCLSEPAQFGEWGILKTSSVTWSGFKIHENKKLPSGFVGRQSLVIKNGDVLMTRAGPNSRVGVVSLVDCDPGQLMLSDKIYRLKPITSLEPGFLALALSSDQVQRELDSLKTGLAESQTNISQAIVRRLNIGLASKAERLAILEIADDAKLASTALSAELDKLRLQKSGLMQDLLTGKVSVAPLLESAA